MRAVLQDALVSSDEGVRDFLYRCTTVKKDGRQVTAERRGSGAAPSAAAPSTLLQADPAPAPNPAPNLYP